MIGQALATIASRRVAPWLIGAVLIVLIAFPLVAGAAGRYYTVLLMTVFIFATLGHAWNLLAGFCGLLSFGIQVYVGLAGFTVAILQYYMGVPIWLAMGLGVVTTAAFALVQAVPLSERHIRRNTWIGVIAAVLLWAVYEGIIAYNPAADVFGGAYIRRVILLFLIFLGALPLLKLQGPYFAVATWLIAAAVASIFNEWKLVGAGGGMSIANETTLTGRYYVGLIVMAGSTAVVWWLLRSRYGQALTAVRDDEEAAAAVGIDIRKIKTMVFLISAPMAGLAASLYYIDAVSITPPDAFHIRWSAYAVFIVVAGGMGTLAGPIIGAVVFIIVQRFLVGLWGGGDLTLGIAAVLLILLLPRGIAGWLADLRDAEARRRQTAPRRPTRVADRAGEVVSASLLPSSPAPHLLPGTPAWQQLRQAIRTVADRVSEAQVDTLILFVAAEGRDTGADRHTARLTGQVRDPVYADFGEIAVDMRFDGPLARALEAAEVPLHQPREAGALDSGIAAALAELDPAHRTPVVIVDLAGRSPDQAAELGRTVSHVARDTGRRVALVGLTGLSGSARRADIDDDPGGLASEPDDLANRRILGWLQSGDLLALRRGLADLASEAEMESDGAVIAAVAAAAPGPADVLGYAAIFGAGVAVTNRRGDEVT